MGLVVASVLIILLVALPTYGLWAYTRRGKTGEQAETASGPVKRKAKTEYGLLLTALEDRWIAEFYPYEVLVANVGYGCRYMPIVSKKASWILLGIAGFLGFGLSVVGAFFIQLQYILWYSPVIPLATIAGGWLGWWSASGGKWWTSSLLEKGYPIFVVRCGVYDEDGDRMEWLGGQRITNPVELDDSVMSMHNRAAELFNAALQEGAVKMKDVAPVPAGVTVENMDGEGEGDDGLFNDDD